MKLLFTEVKGKIDCEFKGDPQEAVEAILTVMSQEDLIAKIILVAAEVYTDRQEEIEDEVLENSVVTSTKTKK